jgi:hypothetical protein
MYARRHALLFVALASATTLTAEALAAAPRFKMVLDSATAEHGVKTVSLVKNPAIQRGWVALSAVEPAAAKRIHLSEVGQRQVLTGPALIPGQEIVRLDEKGEPYFIVFDEENIRLTQRQYAKQLCHTSTNEDHATDLQGNVVEENWIIEDPACDKAVALGLSDLPKGTWMMSMHVPDADYWQNEIATGNKTGFSIEGLFSSEQLTLSAAKPTMLSSVKNWFQKLTAKLSAEKAAEVAVTLGVVQLADGRAVSIDDATGAVTVANADGTPGEVLPDGSYELEGGGTLVVEGGVRKAEASATEGDANLEGDKATAPAPLAPDADLAAVVAAINQLIGAGTKPAENPASNPAAPKLAEQLHKVAMSALGEKLTELKLDAIELEGGGKLVYNAVTRQLRDEKGALAESGYYAAADGSYFNVSTDQYIYEISKPTYDAVYLQKVELEDAKAKLAKAPAAQRLTLGGDTSQGGAGNVATDEEAPTRAQLRLAAVRARNQKPA